jgi:hypothetical protein
LHIDNLYNPLESVNSFYLRQSVVEVKLMDEISAPPSAIEKAKNGREIFSDKIADEIVAACGSGFTLEKAGALVGVNPSTIRTWAQRKPDFGKRVETARKKHELSLLRDVQLAGEKSWQAKAWILERGYNWAQPSARLNVTQDVTHGLSSNLASLLAGIAGKKKAQVIDCKDVTPKTLHTIRDNSYCATDATQTIVTTTPKVLGKTRHRRMRTRKPRAESLAKYTTTPPLPPPAAV